MHDGPLKRIIHLVDNLEMVNIGVWNAAISTSSILAKKGIVSEIWYPAVKHVSLQSSIAGIALESSSYSELDKQIKQQQLNSQTDIIITHGCWRYPTKWGARLKQNGFTFIYTPHGMLEPWPMRHKFLKKKLYFKLKEQQMAALADTIRAVSKPEKDRLSHLFKHNSIVHIPNGVICAPVFINRKSTLPLNFVFMARLHHKKGIIPLVKAWIQSFLANNQSYRLQIAGPDEGELPVLQSLIKDVSNIEYLGVVSGAAKEELLSRASYYVLPSFSEGFPTSLLEAMEKGAIPVITKDCNFNEIFDEELGYKITTGPSDIKNVLEALAGQDEKLLKAKYEKCYRFIKANYTLEHIAELQFDLYTSLLNRKSSAQHWLPQ